MAEQRMSLEDAGRLLGGLHPNTVRSRARNGKIPYEKDNSGKWWVFLDPDKAANDPPRKPSKSLTMEAPIEPSIVSSFKILEATIQALNLELEAVRAERDTLRTRATATDRLEAEAAGLQRLIDNLQEDLALTRADRESWRDQSDRWRQQAERLALLLPPPPPVLVPANDADPSADLEVIPQAAPEAPTGGFRAWLARVIAGKA